MWLNLVKFNVNEILNEKAPFLSSWANVNDFCQPSLKYTSREELGVLEVKSIIFATSDKLIKFKKNVDDFCSFGLICGP